MGHNSQAYCAQRVYSAACFRASWITRHTVRCHRDIDVVHAIDRQHRPPRWRSRAARRRSRPRRNLDAEGFGLVGTGAFHCDRERSLARASHVMNEPVRIWRCRDRSGCPTSAPGRRPAPYRDDLSVHQQRLITVPTSSTTL